ncbi:hypothetical protein FNJ47_36910, partial [Bradyrhizobium sp. UFLA 03-164]|nr:hypothetical protein [Bradyrhizobium uaiense]
MFIPDSRRAWLRLVVAVVIGSLGSVGMWSVVVALPGETVTKATARRSPRRRQSGKTKAGSGENTEEIVHGNGSTSGCEAQPSRGPEQG